MKIHIMVGAHHTAAPHIRKTLEANRALLAKHGTHIPKSDVAEKAVWGAIKAVRKWKYQARTKDGIPIATDNVSQRIRFTIEQ